MRLVSLLIVVTCLSLGGYYGYRVWGGDEERPPYEFEKVQRDTIVSTVTATGVVEPIVNVLVGSQVSGTVVRYYKDFNDPVREGDLLAELDQDQLKATVQQRKAALAAAKARAAEASARLTEASLMLKRIESAYAQNSASDYELDTARAGEEAARAAELAASAQIEIAAAELKSAEIQLDKTVIRAPIDGVIISRDVDAGQTVAASLSAPTLFTIANDLRKMRVNAAVSETDIGKITEGMSAGFRVDAYPERNFTGTVTQVRYAETVVDNVVTYETLIHVSNPELLLRPGMTATIIFEVEKAENVICVPNSALRFDPHLLDADAPQQTRRWSKPMAGRPRKPRVYTISGGQLNEVTLELGINDGRRTQVLAGEIAEGDEVIVGTKLTTRGSRLF